MKMSLGIFYTKSSEINETYQALSQLFLLEANCFFHIRYLKRGLFEMSFSTLEKKKRNNMEILVAEYINIT